ncbi:hypothetical protein D9M68_428510 [compost metagenome]
MVQVSCVSSQASLSQANCTRRRPLFETTPSGDPSSAQPSGSTTESPGGMTTVSADAVFVSPETASAAHSAAR